MHPVLLFFLGLFCGSFANVVSLRIQSHTPGILLGKSECPQCKTLLKWYENLPVIAWILLRGKCSHCKTPISWQYPAVEMFFGVLFLIAGLFAPEGDTLGLIWMIGLFFGLGILTLSDVRYMEIPDPVSFATLRFLLLLSIGNMVWGNSALIPSLSEGLLGAVVLFCLFFLQILIPGILYGIRMKKKSILSETLLSPFAFLAWALLRLFFLHTAFEKKYIKKKEKDEEIPSWIGGGDLRIVLIMGISLGVKMGLVATFLAYIIGTVFSIPLLVRRKASPSSHIPFGPFLTLGCIISVLWGEEIFQAYFGLLGI